MDPSDKTTPALPSSPVAFDSVVTADESRSPENPRITDHESNSVAPADEPTYRCDPTLIYHQNKDKMTFETGALEIRYYASSVDELYDGLTAEIGGLMSHAFQPTPWDKLRADDQHKLKS